MYSKEIVNAIYMNHMYEYCIVNRNFEILKYSDKILKYCDESALKVAKPDLFDVAPELVGMDDELYAILEGVSKELHIPLVHKASDEYVNIHVYHSSQVDTFIVLFENITNVTKAQLHSQQIHNENLLLLGEIEEKNVQLEAFNHEMKRMVEEEVAKNMEKQHMIELQTRHAQMGEMMAMIIHQWKQPLSVIQTLGTLLKMKFERGTLTQTLFTEKIDNLLNQAVHMEHTVSDFQRFFTPSKEEVLFDIKETIFSVVHLVEMEYKLQNISITVTEDTEVSVYGYPNEYTQVILAILQNAKDALVSSKQLDKQITIRIQRHNGHSLVTIRDNAGGIPKEVMQNVFTQYMTTKENGTGLGLYIAKCVIENNMKGKLWVNNIDGGAEFSIRL